MSDQNKIQAGRQMIEDAGGFGVVIWVVEDITGAEGFSGTDEAAEEWIQLNHKWITDYLIEKGNEYIFNECDLLTGEAGDDTEGATIEDKPDWDKIREGLQLIEEGGGFSPVVWTIGDVAGLEEFVGSEDQAWEWIDANVKWMTDYLTEKGNILLIDNCELIGTNDLGVE